MMPRKGENIYKRKDGRWEGRYIKSRNLNGKARYGYVYAKTYREVKEKLNNAIVLKKELKETSALRKDSDSFQNIAMEWLKLIQPQVKESTLNKYQNMLEKYVFPYFKKISISDITNEYMEIYCNNLLVTGGKKGSGLSAKTVSDTLSVIKSILQYAAKKGTIAPCDTPSIQVKRNLKEMRVLTRNEQEKLCRYLYSDLNATNIGILICLFTGIRIGEICALRWEDISINEQTIYIHKTMQRLQDKGSSDKKTKIMITEPKSACSVRTIPIPNDLANIIASFKTVSIGYFLTNSDLKFVEPRTMQNRFKKVLKNSCVDSANFHSLRHTFATRCVELGFDVKSLSEILGHASVNITMNRYVHPSMELKKENMQRLSALLTVK